MTPEQIKQKNTELFHHYQETRLGQLKIIDEMEKHVNELKFKLRIRQQCISDFESILKNRKPHYEDNIKRTLEDLFQQSDNLFDQLNK